MAWTYSPRRDATALRRFATILSPTLVMAMDLPGTARAAESGWMRLRPNWPHGIAALVISVAILAGCPLAGRGAEHARPPEESVHALRTLTTAREVHSLSSQEAARAYPVHLRGVVTFFDPYERPVFFHDSSGSIFVRSVGNLPRSLANGMIVDVLGVSDPGEFAPIVANAQVRVIGPARLPERAKRATRVDLFSGAEDGQWVEVEGIVHSVNDIDHGHYVQLELGMADGSIAVTIVKEGGADYSGLVDAEVRIHANAAPLFDSRRRHMIGAHLLCPNRSCIKVVGSQPGDPFKLPVMAIDKILRWDQMPQLAHRVHLRGKVTLQWPGLTLCIRDATAGICAQSNQGERLAVGDVVDLVGFSKVQDFTSILGNGEFRRESSGNPVSAEPVVADQALLAGHDSELIQIEGSLIGTDLSSSDGTLLLSSGNLIIAAVLPRNLMGPEAEAWKNGSRLRISGICSVQFDPELSALRRGEAVPKSFRILMRSPDDVVVVQWRSWWTVGHAFVLLALVLTGTLMVLVWVVTLRRRLEQQTHLLRESEERFRHMAQHDTLTGLATRLVLRDRLHLALETAKRRETGLGLLLLDIDNFKEINDRLGHLAGDEVLRVLANRIVETIRKSDTAARMGGDEFVVLLPDLSDPQGAERLAAKLVLALSAPVLFAGQEVPVSASVGVCTASGEDMDEAALLTNADEAMYQAKARGRNRFHVFTPRVKLCAGPAAGAAENQRGKGPMAAIQTEWPHCSKR